MRRTFAIAVLFGALSSVTTGAAAQGAPVPMRLEVRGDSLTPVMLTEADLAALPHAVVSADDHGTTARFSGIPLEAVLRRAGVPVDSVRGRRVADYVLVVAADGYRALFSLAEVSPALGGRRVLVADARDGRPLDGEAGPLRLIVPDDAHATRWVRQVTTIIVRRAEP